jgi:hypothetical protein
LHRISKQLNQSLLQGNNVEDIEDFEAEEETKKAASEKAAQD